LCKRGSFAGGGLATARIEQVRMPSGDLVWVRIEAVSDADGLDHRGAAAEDVTLGRSAMGAADVSGFSETVRGVVDSVWQALAKREPEAVSVEFGIEISAHTGRLLGVLAEAGGTAHIKVTASWGKSGLRHSPPGSAEAATSS
jgi:Trypsin-co-occurring domain 1